MKIEVNIEKKYFFGLMIIGLVILGVVGVVAYNIAGTGGDPAVFGHSVDEIDWTKTIQGNVSVNGTINATRICIGNICQTIWPLGGGADTRCDISGTCAQLCIGTDCRTVWPSGTGGAGGVSKIIAGSGITINPATGIGDVTISATGTGTGGGLPTCTIAGQVLKWSGSAWGCGSDVDTDTDTNCNTAGSCSQVCIGSSCKTSWPVGVTAKTCPSGEAVIAISSTGVLTCGAVSVSDGGTGTLTWKRQCVTNIISGSPTCSTYNCGSYKIYDSGGMKVCVGSTYNTPITSCTENAACTISGQYCVTGNLYSGYSISGTCCGLSYPSLYSQTGGILFKCS